MGSPAGQASEQLGTARDYEAAPQSRLAASFLAWIFVEAMERRGHSALAQSSRVVSWSATWISPSRALRQHPHGRFERCARRERTRKRAPVRSTMRPHRETRDRVRGTGGGPKKGRGGAFFSTTLGGPTSLESSGSTRASRSSTAVGSGLSGARSRRYRDQVIATSLEMLARFTERWALGRLPVGLASARISAASLLSFSA